MAHAKRASMKRKRGIKALPALGAAGLSLSLASGAPAAINGSVPDTLTLKTGMSYEITLSEEEISDVSLATFYIFDNEEAGTSRRGLKLAQGGCGCAMGCGGGGDEGPSYSSSYSVASPVGRYGNPPSYSTRAARRYAQPTKRRHVPK
jgi:hypothetical protein